MEYQVITPSDAKYPKKLKERLGADCPSKLYYDGSLEFLNHFTLATVASDEPIGAGIRAFWDCLFTIMEYEMNYISGWYSVVETEMFMRGLFTGYASEKEKFHNYVTLFSAKGLNKESYEDFLLYRFYPPFDKIPVRDEYFRRAKADKLLMLSATEPHIGRQLRKNIVERNFLTCALSDLVYLPWAPKGSKTYTLAKRIIEAKIPVFTVEDPEVAGNLHQLGIPGFNRKTVKALLEEHGAKPYIHIEPRVDISEEALILQGNNQVKTPIQYELPSSKSPSVKESSSPKLKQEELGFTRKRTKTGRKKRLIKP